ncbi:acyl-homoserine-lactone synthase [Pseudaestuariivita sp.]|uniref:acyl-homoserine-lactone synthase n=1 Tax=Pseudaestuariivita sp. TaxID=2211669 RepID=UPI00405A13EE
MIRYIYANALAAHPTLAETMFRDRARQFKERQGWDVAVDAEGLERDAYDALNPLYVIWENADGTHGGSMRLLPTTGATMVNDHFEHLTGGAINSALIWECTRFCLAPGAPAHVAAALMLAGGEVLQGFGITHFIGVFDARMVRIYRRIGASPDVLGSSGTGRDKASVGLWNFTPEANARLSAASGILPAQSRAWFEAAFGSQAQPAKTA